MYACDFEYDGRYLSDFGYIICKFDSNGGVDTSSKGSEIEFTKVALHSGKKYYASGTKYNECLTATFQICRNPELYTDDVFEITREDFRDLSRWLNRRRYYKFRTFDMAQEYLPQPYYYATFNLTKIEVDGRIYGVELKLTTNSPFGYAPEKWFTHKFDGGDSVLFSDPSDEIGNTYPTTIITCKEDGDVEITNDFTGCDMVIKNCTSGEVITLSGETMIITSSDEDHDIANDFNYDFFSFGNSFENRSNIITSSAACKFEIGYEAIVKDTI